MPQVWHLSTLRAYLALLPLGLHILGGGSGSARQHGCERLLEGPREEMQPTQDQSFPLEMAQPPVLPVEGGSGADRAFLETALDSATGVCVLKRGCPRGVRRRKAVLLMFPIMTLTVSSFLVPEPQESLVQLPNCFMLQKVGVPLN